MKKRILSVLLVIALLVTVGVLAAQAGDTAPTPAEIIAAAEQLSFPYAADGEEATNQTGVCPICGGSAVTWEPMTAATGGYTLNTTQHLYVAAETVDLGTSYIYPKGGNLHLFLNNSTITGSGGYMITNGGTISIFGNGTVTNTTDQEVFYPRSSAWSNRGIVIYGGTYESKTGYAANIWNTKVTSDENFKNFVMYGGEVKGLTMGMGGDALIEGGTISACADGTGAQAVYVYSAAGANANDIIIGGSAEVTGGILQNKVGTVTITGEAEVDTVTTKTGNLTISGGTVTTVNKTSSGDLTVSDGTITTLTTNKGTLAISGGEITTATVTGATLSLSGAPEIATLDLSAATTLPATVANMTSGANIGIKVASDAVIAENVTATDAKCFHCDDPMYKISLDENSNLVVDMRDFDTAEDIVDYAENNMFFGYEGGEVTAFCPVCKAERTWQPRDSAYGLNINGGGDKHLYIAQQTWSPSGKIYTGYGATHLNLNGATITANHDSGVFYSQTTDTSYGDNGFSVMGAGTITQNGNGSVFFANNGGYLNVYGGTYSASSGEIFYSQSETSTITFNGGAINSDTTFSEGTLNIKGGTINGKLKMLRVGDIYDDEATINCDVDGLTIDVYGRDNITVGGAGAVKLMDSKSKETADAAVSSYGHVTLNNQNAVTADSYIRLSEKEDKVSFHYYDAKISGVSLKPSSEKIGLYFKATWTTDSALRQVADVGVVVSTKEQPTETFFEDYLNAEAGNHKFFFHSYNAANVVNGVAKTSVLVNGIMKDPTNADRYSTNSTNGSQGKIYAAAYIMIPSETDDESDYILKVSAPVAGQTEQTVYSVLNLFDDNETAFNANKDALNKLYTKWQGSMSTWAFDRIGVTE